MKFKSLLIFGLSSLLILTACSKDEGGNVSESSLEESTAVESSLEESSLEESSLAESSQSAEGTDEGSSEGEPAELALEDLLNPNLPSLSDFSVTTLDGESIGPELLEGKDLTLVNVWMTSCGACIEEMPDLAKLEKKLPENVQLLTMCIDGKQNEDRTREILADANFEGLTLVETSGDMSAVIAQVMYTPTTLLFDEEGNALGDQLVGVPADVELSYMEIINIVLKAMGKDTI